MSIREESIPEMMPGKGDNGREWGGKKGDPRSNPDPSTLELRKVEGTAFLFPVPPLSKTLRRLWGEAAPGLCKPDSWGLC